MQYFCIWIHNTYTYYQIDSRPILVIWLYIIFLPFRTYISKFGMDGLKFRHLIAQCLMVHNIMALLWSNVVYVMLHKIHIPGFLSKCIVFQYVNPVHCSWFCITIFCPIGYYWFAYLALPRSRKSSVCQKTNFCFFWWGCLHVHVYWSFEILNMNYFLEGGGRSFDSPYPIYPK